MALACGLFLLNVPPPLWAAEKKKSPRPGAHRVEHKAVRGTVSKRPPAEEFGPADVLNGDRSGLHGQASFYNQSFHGRRTSTGERYDVGQFTAATNHFPLGSLLAVRRVDNDRCAIVRVNDRMHGKHRRRIIDVSRSVAEYLDMIRPGVAFVRIAPLRKDRMVTGESACRAAFDVGPDCENCGQPPKLPKFSTDGEG